MIKKTDLRGRRSPFVYSGQTNLFDPTVQIGPNGNQTATLPISNPA